MLKLRRRARGHFVTPIAIRVHLIRVNPGHISNIYTGHIQEYHYMSTMPVLNFNTYEMSKFN